MKTDAKDKLCLHCGTPVPTEATDARFCCAGCRCVYEMLCSQGLEKFYDLRGTEALTPVTPQSLRARDYTWLEGLVQQAEQSTPKGQPSRLDLAIQGLSCVACVWLIDRLFQKEPGAVRVEIHPARGELSMDWSAGFSVVEFARRLQGFGYLLGPRDAGAPTSLTAPLARRTGLCGAFALNAMAFTLPTYLGMSPTFQFASWFDLVAAFSATLALLVGGSYFAERSWRALKQGVLHIDTPITLGIGAAWCGSLVGWITGTPGLKYFDFVAVFIFLMLAGRWLQQAALERNRRRLLQGAAVPQRVQRQKSNGATEITAVDSIQPGWLLVLRSGEICPVAARLIEPAASLSFEWINGESEAAHLSLGQKVPSGALNIGVNSITVEALEKWPDSLLHRLVAGQGSSSEAAPFVANLLRGYLSAVVCLGILGAVVWWLNGSGLVRALQIMISVFVVSCPCALGVAAPFADDLAASWMQRLGVFVRSPFLWQRLVRVRKVIFDKTGTLTMENPALKNAEVLDHLNSEQRSALRILVTSNLHPVSRSLFDALGPIQHSAVTRDFGNVEEVTGQGLRILDARGCVWSLGRPSWLPDGAGAEKGDAVFACDGKVLARFEFEDALRPETMRACHVLKEGGCSLFLLSGDRKEKVKDVAGALGIPASAWHAELTPEEKKRCVESLDDRDTLYLGDGANDSLALEAALCCGSPVTGRNFLEHRADFYFLGNSLRFVPRLLEVARKRRRAVTAVFAFASLYNAGAVALCLWGMMSPLLAAVLMPLSSVVTLAMVRGAFGPDAASAKTTLGRPQDQTIPPQTVRGFVSMGSV